MIDQNVYLSWEQEPVCGSCGCGPCQCDHPTADSALDALIDPANQATVIENGHEVATITAFTPEALAGAVRDLVAELNQCQHERNLFTEIRVIYGTPYPPKYTSAFEQFP